MWEKRGGRAFLVFLISAYGIHKIFLEKIPGIVVDSESGKIRGIISISREGREYYEWLGISYAKPPLGALRFAAPSPIEPWDGILDGSSYGGFCLQFDTIFMKTLGGEDCLFLNIHTPKKPMDEGRKLPVIFSIHGGYFSLGYSNLFRPTYFMDEDVVFVTMNYRLGAFGFLSTNDSTIRGNMGLKDQSLALKWVYTNIGRFGGDPSEITVMGESAGGISAGLHMLSPLSSGMIARVICQSGHSLSRWGIHGNPWEQAKSFAQRLNCPTGNSKDMAICLRNINAQEIAEAHVNIVVSDHVREDVFVPTVEYFKDSQTFLPAHPLELYKSQEVKKLPLLVGGNKDEGGVMTVEIFRNESFLEYVSQDWRRVLRHIVFMELEEIKFAEKIGEFYLGPDWDKPLDVIENLDTISKICADNFMNVDLNRIIKLHSRSAPAYAYWYGQRGPTLVPFFTRTKKKLNAIVDLIMYTIVDLVNEHILRKTPRDFGVTHADELLMQFEFPPVFNMKTTDPLHHFSKDFIKTWVMFAQGKIPEFRGTKFPANSPDNVEFVEIIDTDKPNIIKFPFPERMDFWEELHGNKGILQ